MKELLLIMWWIYVGVMMLPEIFMWQEFYEFFIKIFITLIMVILPACLFTD
tara:strand:+ start:132 stop:284 length:153 start_codon:yes stop_codon:yes gene_type:complete